MTTKNKKFNLTSYHPFRSNDFRSNSQQLTNRFKSAYQPYRSIFLKRQESSKMRQSEIQKILVNKNSVFSMEKYSYQKRKEQKQFIQKAHLPNFNIKRFFDKVSNKKGNEGVYDMSRSQSLSERRQATAQPALKRYWQRYLNQQISYADLAKGLNKNITDIDSRQKKNQSQVRINDEKDQQSENKIEKSAFYINNFIKTTYRKKRFEYKAKIEAAEPIKQVKKIQIIPKIQKTIKTPKTPKKREVDLNFGDQKSWSMIPWQKFNQVEEQQFIPL